MPSIENVEKLGWRGFYMPFKIGI